MSIESCRDIFRIPVHSDPETRRLWDLVAQHSSGSDALDASRSICTSFDLEESESGVALTKVLEELSVEVVSRCINVNHPFVLGHMHPPPAAVSVFADFLIGAMNQCAFIWEEAPLAASVEAAVIQWLCRRIGLASAAGGLLTSGGTMSNTLASYLALARADGRGKPQRERLSIVCTDQAHISVDKAAALIGLGPHAVVRIRTDRTGRLEPGAVMAAVRAEMLADRIPFLLVCTAGTTNSGTIEDADEFLEAARIAGAWCHIDAAHGGLICLSPRYRGPADRWHGADSVSWDPHKSLYVSYSSGALLLREASMNRPLEFHSEYALKIDESDDAGYGHFEGSRRFEALKIWMTIRHIGVGRYREMVEHLFGLARELARILEQSDDFALLTFPDTNIVCFRHMAPNTDRTTNSLLNKTIQQVLYRSGAGPYVSSTTVNGDTYLRVVLTNPALDATHLDHLLQKIRQQALICRKRSLAAA